jgi:hypothetical protein
MKNQSNALLRYLSFYYLLLLSDKSRRENYLSKERHGNNHEIRNIPVNGEKSISGLQLACTNANVKYNCVIHRFYAL